MCVCVRVWEISEQDQMCFVQMTARDGKLTENKTKKKQITGDDIVSSEKKITQNFKFPAVYLFFTHSNNIKADFFVSY